MADMTAKVQIEVASAEASANLRAFEGQFKATFAKVEADLRVAEEAAQKYQTTMRAMGEVGMGLMAAGAGALFAAKGMLDLAGNMQQAKIGFTTLLGSASAATKMVKDLQEFAAQTPFEFVGLQDTAKKMLAFGFEAKSIIPSLRSLGDAMSALGGGSEAMDRVVRAMGQMRSKGRAQAEELLQLAEAGIPVYQILQEELNMTGAEVAKIGEKGVKADVVIKALMTGLDKRFGGGMAAQAGTWQQVLSNLADNAKMAAAELGEGLVKPVSFLVGKLTDLLAIVRALPPGFKEFAGAATGGLGAAALSVGALLLAASKAEAAWAAVAATAKLGWAAMINPATIAVAAILTVIAAVVLMAGSWRKAEADQAAFHDAVVSGGEKEAEAIRGLRKEADELAASIKAAGDAISETGASGTLDAMGRGLLDFLAKFSDLIGFGFGQEEAEKRLAQQIEDTNTLIDRQEQKAKKAYEGLSQYTKGSAAYQGQVIAFMQETLNLLALEINAAKLAGDQATVDAKTQAYKAQSSALDAAKEKLKDLTKEEKAAAEQATAIAQSADEVEKFNDAWAKTQDSVKKASDAMQDANTKLGEVIEKTVENVAKAAENVQKAKDAEAEANEKAAERVADAAERVQDAKDAEAEAYEKAADREMAALERLEEAQEKANQALLTGEERALAKLQSAHQKLIDLNVKEWEKTATPEEKEAYEAEMALEKRAVAEKEFADAQREAARFGQVIGERGIARTPAEFEADKIAREGDKAIGEAEDALEKVRIDNKKQLADAAERVADAEKAYNKALEEQTKIREEGAKRVADAVKAENKAVEDGAKAIQEAYKKREEAIQKYAETVVETNAKMVDSYNKLAAAQRKAGVPEDRVLTQEGAAAGAKAAQEAYKKQVAGVVAQETQGAYKKPDARGAAQAAQAAQGAYKKIAGAWSGVPTPEDTIIAPGVAAAGGQAVAPAAANTVTVNVWGNIYGDEELRQKIRDEATAALKDAAYAR